MKQPKFNFTDLLKPKRSEKPGKYPLGIKFDDGEFHYYFNELEINYKEEELELYQEPQKKKLYAYRVYGKLAEIRMFKFELAEDMADYNHLERDPEHDIEYPEKNEN